MGKLFLTLLVLDKFQRLVKESAPARKTICSTPARTPASSVHSRVSPRSTLSGKPELIAKNRYSSLCQMAQWCLSHCDIWCNCKNVGPVYFYWGRDGRRGIWKHKIERSRLQFLLTRYHYAACILKVKKSLKAKKIMFLECWPSSLHSSTNTKTGKSHLSTDASKCVYTRLCIWT